MHDTTRGALVSRLSNEDRVVEVGIGARPGAASALADAGVAVTATDICKRTVPDSVVFVQDDVTAPDRSLYEGADALYGLNLPPELQRPTTDLARSVGARCLFTTLGGDPVVVPVTRESVPGGTLYRSEPRPAEK